MNLTIRSMNVYVPAEDFQLSKRFYAELGFEMTEAWGGNVDCRLGNSLFRLQNYFVKGWAENFMLQFVVEDARAWYDHVKPIIDSGRFPNARNLRAGDGRGGHDNYPCHRPMRRLADFYSVDSDWAFVRY